MDKASRILPAYILAATLFTALSAGYAAEAITTKTLTYYTNDTTLRGYLAANESLPGKRPGILVVHEWWGLTDHPKNSANELARLGYTALAVDMYGDGRSTGDPKQAGAWAAEVRGSPQRIRERMQAALDTLKRQPSVDPEHIAAIGYCFGGTIVLEAARMGMDIGAVASFHGGLATSVPPGQRKIHAAILVLHGAADPAVPQADIDAFHAEMEAAQADWQMIYFGGAVHAFTNPQANTLPTSLYHPKAAARSWLALQSFLKEVFP